MRNLLFVAGLAAAAATPAASQPTANALTPAVTGNLQCLVLYMIAAGTEKDEKRLTGAIAGTWYFLGRLDASAPGLNLEPAIRAELAGMQGNPETKEIGAACDAQFSKRGADLTQLGQNFQKATK